MWLGAVGFTVNPYVSQTMDVMEEPDVEPSETAIKIGLFVERLFDSTSAENAFEVLCEMYQFASDPNQTSPSDFNCTGAVSAVTHAMRSFDLIAIQYRGLSILRTFSVAPELRSEILREGGLELALGLMSDDLALTVQDRGVTLIANLSVGCAHRKRRLAREGAILAVVSAMQMFPCDTQMQIRGSLALRNMCHNAQVNQYIAEKSGAVQVVLDALLQLGDSSTPELIFQTVAALESMCTWNKTNRSTIVQQEMDSWPERIRKAATNLSVEQSQSVDGRGPTEISASLLVANKCSTAKRMSSDGTLWTESELAAQFSQSAPGSNTGVPDVDSVSLFRVYLRAVRKSPENRALLRYVLSLFVLLSWKQPMVQIRLGELGAIEIALATVKRYESDTPLVTRACTLIGTLCLRQKNRERVTSGLGVLMRTLEKNIDNLSTTREIATALSNAMFCSPRNRESFLARKGARTVSEMILHNEGRDLNALEAGLCALRNLVDGHEEGALQCASANGLESVRAALDCTKEVKTVIHERVQVQAILLLGDIAKSAPTTISQMRELEVSDWIENGLSKLDRSKQSEAHIVGDELILSLQGTTREVMGPFSSEIDGEGHSFSFSGRWAHTKEIFQSLAVPFSSNTRTSEPVARRGGRRRFVAPNRENGNVNFLKGRWHFRFSPKWIRGRKRW